MTRVPRLLPPQWRTACISGTADPSCIRISQKRFRVGSNACVTVLMGVLSLIVSVSSVMLVDQLRISMLLVGTDQPERGTAAV